MDNGETRIDFAEELRVRLANVEGELEKLRAELKSNSSKEIPDTGKPYYDLAEEITARLAELKLEILGNKKSGGS